MNFTKITIALCLMMSLLASAQKKVKTPTADTAVPLSILKQAQIYGDGLTAINALHQIIAIEGEKSTYKDTLAVTYFKTSNFLSCHLIAKELLNKKPTDLVLLELNATSLQQLNAAKEAIDAFEKLFVLSKNKYHGYQLATLQYGIKRLAEAQTTINQTQTCEDLKDIELQFNIDKNQTQKVPLNAAILNMKGLITYELNDKISAKTAFEEALKISPEFALAKQNKAAIELETTQPKQ